MNTKAIKPMSFEDARELAGKHNLIMKETYSEGDAVYFMVENNRAFFFHKNENKTYEPIFENIREYMEDFARTYWIPVGKNKS